MSPLAHPLSRAALTSALVAGLVVPGFALAADADAGVFTVGSTTRLVTSVKGNGHGHGMSQYGARGAALAGKSYASILGFYYPHTTLTKLSPSAIRVKLSGVGSTTTVSAYSGMRASGVSGTLPTSGVKKYRLVSSGSRGLALQQLKTGGSWHTYKSGLPNPGGFSRSSGAIRVFDGSGGGSTAYRGSVIAIRNGDGPGVYTVNRVGLNDYTAGVTPREMPASWPAQAVNSQSVAARSYGRYAVEHASAKHYDICDTTMCQVYGGAVRYDSAGNVLYREDQRAAQATSNRVLRYDGATIFAQFSAANGGYMTGGGQPYLVSKADPYDSLRSGNPYFSYRKTVTVRSVGAYFGLAKVTKLAVTKRDGHGSLGGRVISGYIEGRTASGRARHITVTGSDLQWSMGIGTTWFRWHRG